MTEQVRRGSDAYADPRALYAQKTDRYLAFIRLVAYPRGLAAYLASTAFLHHDMRVLDAGCGTGVLTLALRQALAAHRLRPGPTHGFDLTPAMLDRFLATIRAQAIEGVELMQCDARELATLPAHWNHYDLVISAAMLEYLPRACLPELLRGLGSRLAPGGMLLLFVTRRNCLTRPLIGRWWHARLYSRAELREILTAAGFRAVAFARFPGRFRHLNLWGHIVEAQLQS